MNYPHCLSSFIALRDRSIVCAVSRDVLYQVVNLVPVNEAKDTATAEGANVRELVNVHQVRVVAQ